MKFNYKTATPEALAYNIKGIEFRPFQKYIMQKVMSGIVKGNSRFVISVPPAHGKSELCSNWIPLWAINSNPKRRIIIASYNQQNADKWGRLLRNEIKDNQNILTVKVSDDSDAKRFWHTTEEGSVLCTGIGGAMTGNHGDIIIIDDPFKNWAEAMSQARREAVIDWYNTVVSTRMMPNATIIVIQTRWHENDLSGYLLRESGEKWVNLRFPLISEGAGDLLKRKKGELLCVGLFKDGHFDKQKKKLGSMQFASLYQQTPQADTGNIFLREYWQRYTPEAKPKKFDRIIDSWDTAFETKKANAYSVRTRIGQIGNRFYLLSIWRQKADYPTVKQRMLDDWNDGLDSSSVILLEDKATGKPIRQELTKAGLPIIAVEPFADKLTRAWSVTPTFEDKRVFIPAGESWADDLIAGCASFPAGDWTDAVDTLSQGITFLNGTSGALGADNLADLKIGRKKEMFRFGASLNGFSIRERSHWFRDNVKLGEGV